MTTIPVNILEFLSSNKFLIPFLSTLMASLTVIVLEHTSEEKLERKRKLYAVSYVLDVAYRDLFANLMLNARTIRPHIEAIQRIKNGDDVLLQRMFDIDDFDILRSPPGAFDNFPDEFKVLIGVDSIQLVTMFDVVKYNHLNDENRLELVKFVEKNFKSQIEFHKKNALEKQECFEGYENLLERIEHEKKRSAWYTLYVLVPNLMEYTKGFQFLFFRKTAIHKTISQITVACTRYRESVPDREYMPRREFGGIQEDL